jgi:hypothetical protein
MDKDNGPSRADDDRRAFLAKAGKFAVITPPALTMLLSTTLTSPAIAASGKGGDTSFGDPDHSDNGNHYGQDKNGNNGHHGWGHG